MEKDNNTTHEPILNQPRTLDYNVVCQIVGHLYIELNNASSSVNSNYGSIIENLTSQVSELISENESLKEIVADEDIESIDSRIKLNSSVGDGVSV